MASEIKRRFTDTEMQIARETDLPELLTHLGYQVKRIGRYYTTAEMDSLRIKDRRAWFRYSQNTGGDAITLVQQFCGKTFPEAVEYLLAFNGRARDSPAKAEPPVRQTEPPKPFALPPRNADDRRVFAYLRKRGIAAQVIRQFMNSGLLYEDAEHHNCVFVGKNSAEQAKYAGLRGTYDRDGKGFRGDVAGSDKNIGFAIPHDPTSNQVRVFEAPIDLMSYLSLHREPINAVPKLQECVRQVRHAGAKANISCGIHVHVDAANHNRQSLKNLLSIMYSKEDILFKALQVNERRASRWCQKVREPMLKEARKLSSDETKNLTALESIWYEGNISDREHYNWTRYYALNLHSVFYRGTVEWRCFNSTLHAGKIAAYVNLCLAMSAQAINQRSTVMRKTMSDNELFTFRVWLVRLGLNGEEFKNTRNHLLANLDGDRAWRYDKDSYEVNKKKKKSREMER